MTYDEIDQILLSKNLNTEPAFDDVAITIEPMPNLDGCPLGLYFPDSSLIAIPPDATQAALLHELGHRHGHYYYEDLSERYAEDFRRIYQPKGRVLLYMGNHVERMSKFGVLFEEGEKGAIEIATYYPLTPDEIYDLKYQLYSYGNGEGVPNICCGSGESPFVRFEFTKGFDWPMVIAAVTAASVAALVGILGYGVYKIVKESPWLVPATLVAGLLAVGGGLYFASRKARRYLPART